MELQNPTGLFCVIYNTSMKLQSQDFGKIDKILIYFFKPQHVFPRMHVKCNANTHKSIEGTLKHKMEVRLRFFRTFSQSLARRRSAELGGLSYKEQWNINKQMTMQ